MPECRERLQWRQILCTSGTRAVSQRFYHSLGGLEQLILAARDMCPGDPSKIKCCVLDAKSPLSPANLEEPLEPALSLIQGSEFATLPNAWPSTQEESESSQQNPAPIGNLQANTILPENQDFFVTSNPLFDQTADLGLFDVASLPVAQESEFKALLGGDQSLQGDFSSNDAMFAFASDGLDSLWNPDFTPVAWESTILQPLVRETEATAIFLLRSFDWNNWTRDLWKWIGN